MKTMANARFFLKTIFVFCFLFFGMTPGVYAANFDLVLQWDENTEPDLATGSNPRYKIYYKTEASGAGVKSNYMGQPAGEPNVADEGPSPVHVTVALDENPDPALVQFTLHNLEDTQNYYIAVTALDEAGNESDLSNEVVYEGAVAPVNQGPVVSLLTVNGVSGSDMVYTNHSSGTVSVRIVASDAAGMINQYLILANDSNPLNGTFVNIPAGALATQDFSVNFNLPVNGTHTLYAWVKNDDGHLSAVVSKSNVVLDRTVPAAPTVPDLNAADDTGISNSDNITTRTSGLTLTGSGENGASVQLYNGGTAVGSPVIVSAGVFTTDISLSQGIHSITARQTDRAGNVSSASTPLIITVDTTRPTGTLSYSPMDASHVNAGSFTLTGTFSENLGLAPQITVTGSGHVAINTPQAMAGSGSVWNKVLTIPENDYTAYAVSITNIVDVAGNTASSNLVGNFTTDTVDTDGDGIRDFTDTDDDNDGMPDTWEIQFGLNPKVNDAALDTDGDGVSNLDEYLSQSKPDVPDANRSPEMPTLLAPQTDAVVSTKPELVIGEFIDPNPEDYHAQTEWEVYLDVDGEGDCLFHSKNSSALKTMPVPSLVLDAKTNYTWRARVYDNHGAPSEWSDYGYFTTGENAADADGDGILDDQVPDSSTDINQDGTVDTEQINVVSIKVKGKGSLVGMDATDSSSNVVKILSFHSIATDGMEIPGVMPFGLIDFKVKVQKKGDSATVIIFFSEALPDNAIWYKYNSVNDEWQDASSSVSVSRNRMSLSLILKDGGPLDADGLANGVIIDPSGVVASAADEDDSEDEDGSDPPSASSASGGGGGGCFIQSVQPESGNAVPLLFQWVLIGGILCLMRIKYWNKSAQKRS